MKSFVTMSLYVQLPPLKKTKKIDQTTPGVSHSFKNLYIYGFFFFFLQHWIQGKLSVL